MIHLDVQQHDFQNIDQLIALYSHWRQEKDDVLYLKVLTIADFKRWTADDAIYHKLQCHQIGVMWLFHLHDEEELVQSEIRQIRFYEFGGIRNAVFYHERLRLQDHQK